MIEGLLLDTCAIIWLLEDAELSAESQELIERATETNQVYVSPMSAWEVGMLTSKRRIALAMPVQTWFERILSFPGIVLADMQPKVLIDSSFLPGRSPTDPADRILVATARELGLRLVTRDQALLDYGAAGYVRVSPC